MIPNVFVSSTVEDLLHLREGVRDAIAEIGYSPVMSEFGDVGYLPTRSAEDSCYVAVRGCQIAVLIVSKRYGSTAADGLSVTHKEFRAAREAGIPVISLIDKDVLVFKKVFDANVSGNETLTFPGMDNAKQIFCLIDEITSADVNNGIQPYTDVSSARRHIKNQLAHFFGEMLQRSSSRLDPDIKDILAEMKTLRHELVKPKSESALPFLRILRQLLSKRHNTLASILKNMYGELELAVPIILTEPSLAQFLAIAGWNLNIDEDLGVTPSDMRSMEAKVKGKGITATFISTFSIDDPSESGPGVVIMSKNKEVFVNGSASRVLERDYVELRDTALIKKN